MKRFNYESKGTNGKGSYLYIQGMCCVLLLAAICEIDMSRKIWKTLGRKWKKGESCYRLYLSLRYELGDGPILFIP